MIDYDILFKVNSNINNSTRYKTDIELYKSPEYWNEANGEGDCEDYALAKRRLLIDANVDRSKIHLATCWTETKEYHAVLLVETDEGTYILDNRYPRPMMKSELNYTWHKIQIGDRWCALS